ncbi:MAG: OadG family protein [Clostridia bacterium]|nr:OadG family protein [Clostridia bacterium]
MGAFILNAGAETLEAAEAAAQAAAGKDIPTWFVVVMGMGIVFIGLICLILLISAMGAIMKRVNAKQEAQQAAARAAMPAAPSIAPANAAIPNRSELVAAISVALAEELGKDVKAIRIHSIKRV